MTNDKATCAKRIAVSMALVFGLSTPALPIQAQVPQRSQPARLLVSASPHAIPSDIRGTAKLLIHDMPSTRGGMARASTLLFVPDGTAPVSDWPIVAWAHGTTTPGQKSCTPSLSPDLDGGLTRDGFVSHYAYQIAELVNVGFAVVAPDLEGLGPSRPCPIPISVRIASPGR